ncbi:hypothetical protein D7X33_37005, partial [Butyricicoccus sp. 1XD8-22]
LIEKEQNYMELSIIFLVVMVVAMYVLKVKFPAIKGAVGERFVNKNIHEFLTPNPSIKSYFHRKIK